MSEGILVHADTWTFQDASVRRSDTCWARGETVQDVESRFWQLSDEARFLDAGSLDARASERSMVEIIRLVENHPEHRVTFVRCFSDLALWRRDGPWMLVPFCMRRLRFPEIQELIHRDAEQHSGTAYYASRMNYWSSINHAYLDEVWEAAWMYDYYAHEIPESD